MERIIINVIFLLALIKYATSVCNRVDDAFIDMGSTTIQYSTSIPLDMCQPGDDFVVPFESSSKFACSADGSNVLFLEYKNNTNCSDIDASDVVSYNVTASYFECGGDSECPYIDAKTYFPANDSLLNDTNCANHLDIYIQSYYVPDVCVDVGDGNYTSLTCTDDDVNGDYAMLSYYDTDDCTGAAWQNQTVSTGCVGYGYAEIDCNSVDGVSSTSSTTTSPTGGSSTSTSTSTETETTTSSTGSSSTSSTGSSSTASAGSSSTASTESSTSTNSSSDAESTTSTTYFPSSGSRTHASVFGLVVFGILVAINF